MDLVSFSSSDYNRYSVAELNLTVPSSVLLTLSVVLPLVNHTKIYGRSCRTDPFFWYHLRLQLIDAGILGRWRLNIEKRTLRAVDREVLDQILCKGILL